VAIVDHVMQHDAAIGMHRGIHLRHGAERGNHDRHLVFDAHHQVVLEPFVRHVHDLVDGKGGRRTVRVLGVVRCELFGDLGEPFVQLRFRTRIKRREGADDAGLALGKRQLRMRYDEEWRGDDGEPQIVFQDRRQGHDFTSHEVYVYANVKYQILRREESGCVAYVPV
jgi:hypothetical protein